MKKIFVLGAGLSTPCLIEYLLDQSTQYDWKVYVGDMSIEMAKTRIGNHPNGEAFKFNALNDVSRKNTIKDADLVISMLPARLHYIVANDCLQLNKNMVTAYYVSNEIREFCDEAVKRDIIFLNEMGVDPGIDHMAAMQMINHIKSINGKLIAFRSSTGGLVAPKYDNNPWNYKFTWNPRNVVIAGQSGAQFISQGSYKYIPYHKVFTRIQRLNIDGYGEFETYPNRDSLKYRTEYGLEEIPTIFRGTIRRPGYSKTWNALVQVGAIDDSYIVEDSENLTYRKFINSFLQNIKEQSVEQKFANYVGLAEDSFDMYKLRWLGLFDNRKIGLKDATPAQIIEKLLNEKWQLDKDDKDMIVMQHRLDYEIGHKTKRMESSLVIEGKDSVHTAMAMTVGYPIAIAAKLILTGVISATGVKLPTTSDIYEPVLKELESYDIRFVHKEMDID